MPSEGLGLLLCFRWLSSCQNYREGAWLEKVGHWRCALGGYTAAISLSLRSTMQFSSWHSVSTGCEPKSGNVDRNLWNHSSKWTLSTLGWFSQLSRHTDGKAINTSVRLWGDASVGTVKGLKTQIKLSFKSKGQMIQIASVRNETDPLDVDRIIWLRTGLYMFGNSKKAHQFQYKPARWTW